MDHIGTSSSSLSLNYGSDLQPVSKDWMTRQIKLLTHKEEDGLEASIKILILVTPWPISICRHPIESKGGFVAYCSPSL